MNIIYDVLLNVIYVSAAVVVILVLIFLIGLLAAGVLISLGR